MKLTHSLIIVITTSTILSSCMNEKTQQQINQEIITKDVTIWPKIESEVKHDINVENKIKTILASITL